MRTLNLYLTGFFVFTLLTSSVAQRSASRWANYDAVTTYRLGMQGVNLNELNQALQQAGYSNLSSQMPVFSVSSQFSRPNKAFAFQSEFGFSFGSGSSVTNGTYKTKAGFYYIRLGGSYNLIHSTKFQLGPQLSLTSIPFRLHVAPTNNTTPSLNTVLTNPGSVQTATLRSSTGGIDAGLTANVRIPYSQRLLDCSTMDRSFVIGLDAGYRFASRSPLDASHEISAANPAIQLSGWYAGIRVGIGVRVRSTTAPVQPY